MTANMQMQVTQISSHIFTQPDTWDAEKLIMRVEK